MKTRNFIFVSVITLACAMVAVLASYFFYVVEPNIVDVRNLLRGWPLYWVIESIPLWDYWPLSSRAASFYFQPMSFLIDMAFWLVLFQLPSLIYTYMREAKSPVA